MGILCLLYNRRRTEPEHAGLSVLDLERVMAFPREHLMFTLWYLIEKDFARQNEHSDFVITGAGVDHVESNLPQNKILYNLLKSTEMGMPRQAPLPSEPEQPSPEQSSSDKQDDGAAPCVQ